MKKRSLRDMNIDFFREPKGITIILTAEDIRDMKALVKDVERSPQMGGTRYDRLWYTLIKDLSADTEVELPEDMLAEAFVLAMTEDHAWGDNRYRSKPWFKKFSTLFDWEHAI